MKVKRLTVRLRTAAIVASVPTALMGLTAQALPGADVGIASAGTCPDVQVVFARGTGEPSGVGVTGQAFVDDLRSRVGGRSYDVYPVNYPASDQWSTGIDGVRDAGAHVVSMAKSCPQTQMVLGGYSQGAAVMGFVTSAAVPDGIDPATVPKPLTPDVADHVAAVVLFGMPNVRAMNFLGQPPVVIGPMFAAKTVKVCVTEDPVCSDGLNFAAHDTYADDATMVDQGATFAARRLGLNTVPSNTPAPIGMLPSSTPPPGEDQQALGALSPPDEERQPAASA